MVDCPSSKSEFCTRKDALIVSGYFIYVPSAIGGRFIAAVSAGKQRVAGRSESLIVDISEAQSGIPPR
jgi:hypothetical protein